MILENYKFLKENIINLHNALKNNPYDPENAIFKYDEFNQITYEKNGQRINLFSKVDTAMESSFILDAYEDLNKRDEIILFGIGDGSIIKELNKRVPKSTKIFVIDFMEIFQVLLNHYSFKEMKLDRVFSFTLMNRGFDYKSFFAAFSNKTNGNFEIVVLPQHQRVFNNEIKQFFSDFSNIIKLKRNSTRTNSAFEKRWIINSIKNHKYILDTQNILDLKKYDFSESAAFIISAGPSLDFDIEYIKRISKDNNVYIFGVGSANKALMKHGIIPDAIFTYDPSPLNQHVIKEYNESDIDAPIVFGSSVGFETLNPYNSKFKYHILISQDKLSHVLLKDEYLKKGICDSPSVAIITLQALIKLGFSEIYFAGQNFGFYKDLRYSDGINHSFSSKKISKQELKNKLIVKDVFGNDMVTKSSLNTMRILFEKYIAASPDVKFINTTKYGADIKGAKYVDIEDVYRELDKFNKPLDLKEYNGKNAYDIPKVLKRYNKLNESRLECKDILINLDKKMKIIKDKLREEDYIYISTFDKDIEVLLNRLFRNTYFKSTLRLMNRNYYSILLNNFSKIKNQKLYEKKYTMIYNKIGSLIVNIMKDYNKIIDDFNMIGKYLSEGCEDG